MELDNVEVVLEGKTKSLESSVEELISTLNKLVSSVDETTKAYNNMSGSSQQLQNSTKAMSNFAGKTTGAKVALAGLTAGLTTVFTKLKQWTLSAASAVGEQTRFNSVFNSTEEELRNATQWVDEFSSKLYLDKREVAGFASELKIMTRNLGIGNEQANKMTENLTKIAYDLGSIFQKEPSQVINNISSALAGQQKSMTNYGISLNQATLQNVLYQNGINRTVSSLNSAEKAYLAYYQIMKTTSGQQGYLAKTLSSPANALNIVKTQFSLLAREIGNVFIPILTALVPLVIMITNALRRLAQAIAGLFGIKMDFSKYSKDVGNFGAGIDGIGESADGASKKVKNMLRDFDELHVIDFDTDTGSGAGGGAGGGIGFELPEINYGEIDGFLDDLNEKLGLAAKIIQAIAVGIAGWTIGSVIGKFLTLIGLLDKAKLGVFALGTAFLSAGLFLTFDANKDIRIKGLNTQNIIETILGAIVAGSGAGLLAFSLGAGSTLAVQIGLTVGISLVAINLLTGIAKALNDKYSEQIEQLKNQYGYYDEGNGLGKKISITFTIASNIISEELMSKMEKFSSDVFLAAAKINGIDLSGFKNTLSSLINPLTGITSAFEEISSTFNIFKENVSSAFADVKKEFDDLYNNNKETIDGIINVLGILSTFLIGSFLVKINSIIVTISSAVSGIFTFVTGIITTFIQVFTDIVAGIIKIANGLITFFTGVFTGDWQKTFDGLGKIVSGFVDIIKGLFKGLGNIVVSALNGVISAINTFIRAANKISIPDWEIFGSLAGKGLNIPIIPNIPYFAQGGFPNKGDLFIANEREPELIGSMGNRSVVANNAQITEGIAEASYSGMKRALQEVPLSSDVDVYVGNRQLTDVVVRQKRFDDIRFAN